MNIYLWIAVAFVFGFALGAVTWVLMSARDEDIVKLAPDEVIIKKPNQDMVLVQVPPEVARKLVSAQTQKEPDPTTATEARSIYARLADKAQDAEQKVINAERR